MKKSRYLEAARTDLEQDVLQVNSAAGVSRDVVDEAFEGADGAQGGISYEWFRRASGYDTLGHVLSRELAADYFLNKHGIEYSDRHLRQIMAGFPFDTFGGFEGLDDLDENFKGFKVTQISSLHTHCDRHVEATLETKQARTARAREKRWP